MSFITPCGGQMSALILQSIEMKGDLWVLCISTFDLVAPISNIFGATPGTVALWNIFLATALAGNRKSGSRHVPTISPASSFIIILLHIIDLYCIRGSQHLYQVSATGGPGTGDYFWTSSPSKMGQGRKRFGTFVDLESK